MSLFSIGTLKSKKNGFQVLQAIRLNPKTRDIVTFMVTANTWDHDIQAAISAGADDYITKPFQFEDLAARLRGRLAYRKHETSHEQRAYELDGLTLDPATEIVVLNGRRVELWRTEVVLLKLFLQRPDRILAREFLWDAIRGYQSATSEKVLTKQISNLRTKLGQWGEHLEARRGQGYVLNSQFPLLHD